jgi:hypothetical protein
MRPARSRRWLVSGAVATSAAWCVVARAAADGGGLDGGSGDGAHERSGRDSSGIRDTGDGGDGDSADCDAREARAGSPQATAPIPTPNLESLPTPPATRVWLRGLILEKGTRRPLPAATLMLDGTLAGESDAAGKFALEVAAGRHQIQAFSSGHEPARLAIDATPGRGAYTLRLLPRADAETYETVVRAAGDGAPRVTLEGEESRRTPGSFGDPLRAIESLPGVSQVVWPLALYAIRGANPGNTGFFLDGIRVPTHFHFLLGPAVIHPYFIGGFDFFPGAYPVRYGRFTSGIVAAHTIAPPGDRVHADVDVRLYDTGALVTAPFDGGRGTVAAAARYSYTGALLSALSERVHLWYADYQLRVDHTLAGGKATVFALGSFDSLAFPDVQDRTGALQFHRLALRWTGAVSRFGSRLNVVVAAGADRTETTLLDSPIHVRGVSLAPRVELDQPMGARVDLQIGADAELQQLTPTEPSGTGGGTLANLGDITRRRDASAVGWYGALALRPTARLVVTPAFRLDTFAEQGVTRVEPGPRLFVRAQMTPALAIIAAGGRFAQMPSLPVATAGMEAFDLATLGTQHSWQSSLGTQLRLGAAWSVESTAFFQRFRLSDLRSTLSGDPQTTGFLEMRDGRGYGLEVMIRRPVDERFYGWLAYTLSYSTRDFDGATGPSDWDQRHILNLVAGYRLGSSYTIGARAHYASGRPFPIYEASRLTEYRRLPAFYQLDLRFDRRWIFDRFILNAYLELVNATATREVVEYTRNESGQVQELGIRLLLPSVGVHAQF